MKTCYFILVVLTSLLLASCTKSKVDNSMTVDLNYNDVMISRVKVDYMKNDETVISTEESQYGVSTSLNGKEILFDVPVSSGGLYEVSWKDGWFDGYGEGSIWITGCENDTIYRYFNRSRIIQMTSSSKVISVAIDNNFKLRVCPYNSETYGNYEVNVKEVDKELIQELNFNVQEEFIIASGQVKWFKFDVIKDSTYTLHLDGSDNIGAYGDEVYVNVTALRENVNDSYFEEAYISSLQSFTALENETVFLGVCAAYWWEPREVRISLTEAL